CHGALLFLDLDNFKGINDTMGHEWGDRLLVQVGGRIGACVRATDTVARLGGDEFVVVLQGLHAEVDVAAAEAEAVAQKVLAALNEPYVVQNSEVHSTPSIGIALFRGVQLPVQELLQRADLAMYQAKAQGRNTLCFFDPAMQAAASARSALEGDMRQGILRNEFLLHYQPVVDEAGKVLGAEALVRWNHPQRGMVPPGDFIPLAEQTGLILALGRQVLTMACRQLALWATAPHTADWTVAVNVSAQEFRQPGFADEVLSVLRDCGADPAHLKLELTESLLLHDVEDSILKMQALRTLGVGFSLDDFGTGYSSLSYLKRLPLDQLKIDQSFVRDVLTDPNDATIACTIITLAHSLGLDVVAEGVETEGQRAFLLRNGCQQFQGYLFGRPGPAELL
ncbi:MAG: bifunctional diguanylate cyclase/phosphodiesterase, partial [Acidovorax sp.]|nr:bifunctional diguanylate cyclase/phosphodiesterase [Acidovorax sp.]